MIEENGKIHLEELIYKTATTNGGGGGGVTVDMSNLTYLVWNQFALYTVELSTTKLGYQKSLGYVDFATM